jgi:general secretion pathway protein K
MSVPSRPSERGAALLSVLLIVSVIAVLAATGLQKLKFATHLAANGQAVDQARAYTMAAETVAMFRIGDLVQRDPAKTTLQGNWAGNDVNFPIDGGIASAMLTDGGNCFNLNSLVQDVNGLAFVARPEGAVQFAQLMTLAGATASETRQIAASATDWIDSNGEPLPGGAEDAAYAALPQPYRTANTLMTDPSELRAVAGMTASLYTRLRPLLCALPVTDLSPININTLLPAQAPLLAMLVPGLDIGRADAILAARPRAGYASVASFWDAPGLLGASDTARQQVKLTTRWFGLRLLIELNGAELEEHALIDAAQKPAKLARRSYGEPS